MDCNFQWKRKNFAFNVFYDCHSYHLPVSALLIRVDFWKERHLLTKPISSWKKYSCMLNYSWTQAHTCRTPFVCWCIHRQCGQTASMTTTQKTYLHIIQELEKRIKQDKKHPGVLIELRKSTAIWDIAYFVRDKVITMDELKGFSEDLIDAVKLILSR